MRKILAMLLSVMLLLTAAVAETSAPYAPETVLPLVANNPRTATLRAARFPQARTLLNRRKRGCICRCSSQTFPRRPKLSIGLPCARERDGM